VINTVGPGTDVFVRDVDLGPVPVVLNEASVKSLIGETAVFPRSMKNHMPGMLGHTFNSRDQAQTSWAIWFQVPGKDQYQRIDTPFGTFCRGFGSFSRNFGWRDNKLEVIIRVKAPDQERRLPMFEIKEVVADDPLKDDSIHFLIDGIIGPEHDQPSEGSWKLEVNLDSFPKQKRGYSESIPFVTSIDGAGRTIIHATGNVPRPKEKIDWFMSCYVHDAIMPKNFAYSNYVLIQSPQSERARANKGDGQERDGQ
jgi:hypothetical protein